MLIPPVYPHDFALVGGEGCADNLLNMFNYRIIHLFDILIAVGY